MKPHSHHTHEAIQEHSLLCASSVILREGGSGSRNHLEQKHTVASLNLQTMTTARPTKTAPSYPPSGSHMPILNSHFLHSIATLWVRSYPGPWPPSSSLLLAASLASFPGCRRNGLATSASSNCYFRCLKVGSTNQISERSHMTTLKPNCVMHWTVAVTPIPFQ